MAPGVTGVGLYALGEAVASGVTGVGLYALGEAVAPGVWEWVCTRKCFSFIPSFSVNKLSK